jgi:hypothetical protein
MFCLSFGFVCFECWFFLLSCAVDVEGLKKKRQQLNFVSMAQTQMKNNGRVSKDVVCSKKRFDCVWCLAKMIGPCVRFQRPYITLPEKGDVDSLASILVSHWGTDTPFLF